MPTIVSIDGQLHQPAEATISVFDRGLLYGDSVFETLGTYAGRPFRLEQHLERLARSAALVFIELPVALEVLRREILEALAAAQNVESYVRVIVTRGGGELGLDPGLASGPRRIILVTELHRPPEASYREGVRAISYATQRTQEATEAAGAKIGNYLIAVLAMRRAGQCAANEALIVDAHGRVLEGATSNVFLVRGGSLSTPPTSTGILAGITREVVLEAADEIGTPVLEEAHTLERAYGADEIFVTSSIRQMLAVVTLDERRIGDGRPGPIYRRLFSAFSRIVADSLQ